jgi:hypothetical protein
MAPIADDVVGGFNAYLNEQREGEGQARISLVQFDGQDPFEVLIDGDDLNSVRNLNPRRHQPRGSTPLLDALGMVIMKIDSEILARADMGLPIEDQIVVVITDGHENASTEFNGRSIQELVAARRARAWTFVFLGADERPPKTESDSCRPRRMPPAGTHRTKGRATCSASLGWRHRSIE